jgi:DNA-binding MarR family transcriptional regulator
VKKTLLTKNEEKVLCGLIMHPEKNDSQLSSELNVKLSTLTSIKKRLHDQGFFRKLNVPMLDRLGCELLAVIYAQFNPVIPLEERVKATKKTIEVFDELIFSVGEQEKGFSINLSKNYTNIGRINEVRTETFGRLGLLEKEYPNEAIFPFETSRIIRFFDFSRVLNKFFSLENSKQSKTKTWFHNLDQTEFTTKEKQVYSAIVEHSDFTTQQIGDLVGLSRHTVSRMKKQFFENDLMREITIPDLKKLGFEILVFYHIKFNPNKAPNEKDISYLDSPSTIFLANRKFETVIISAYPTYQEYKQDEMDKIRFLKENNLISYAPFIGTYAFEHMVVIKDFDFAPIVKKTFNFK